MATIRYDSATLCFQFDKTLGAGNRLVTVDAQVKVDDDTEPKGYKLLHIRERLTMTKTQLNNQGAYNALEALAKQKIEQAIQASGSGAGTHTIIDEVDQ